MMRGCPVVGVGLIPMQKESSVATRAGVHLYLRLRTSSVVELRDEPYIRHNIATQAKQVELSDWGSSIVVHWLSKISSACPALIVQNIHYTRHRNFRRVSFACLSHHPAIAPCLQT